MPGKLSEFLGTHVPGYRRICSLPRQLLGINPFDGDSKPVRVPLFKPGAGRRCLPFPHPWNYERPVEILDTFYWGSEQNEGPGRHNRYIEVPWFAPVLVSRDPGIIRAITSETGEKDGQFERDSLASTGIARATGSDTLLFANGPFWKRQRRVAASPFGKTKLFQPEVFGEFAQTFRYTVSQRLDAFRKHLETHGQDHAVVKVEPEIKAVMLEMLVTNFFGAEIPYEKIRLRYVPSLERVIDHIVRDTVVSKFGFFAELLPAVTPKDPEINEQNARFDELTDLVLEGRKAGTGLWKHFKSDAPDEALRSNIKVFLAGALEATTSYASWAISHLARHPEAQERVFQEVKDIEVYTPMDLERAKFLGHVLDETLRLTPSLYFLPRRATADTWVETADGRKLFIPNRTHILLDIWHANRHEDHWGVEATGYPALEFAPERWAESSALCRGSKEFLHFGFGHGPRVCPGKYLGQLEVGLVVGAFVKKFKFKAENPENPAKAGVSTKPSDGTRLRMELR